MKILVTGAAGFIGSHLAQRLVAGGHQVVGLDCYTDYYAKWLKQLNASEVEKAGVAMLPLDLAQDDLSEAVKDVEVVFHCAAQPGISAWTSFETYVRNNVTATYRLLEAVRGVKGLKCFVNMATSSIYGAQATEAEDAACEPTSYYGVTKLAAEQLAMAYYRQWGMPVCSLRLFSVYGPRERPEKLYPKLIDSILFDKEFPLYEGCQEHLRSFTYISDIVDGCEAVVNNTGRCVGEIFNIGGAKEITTWEAVCVVEDIIGRKARFVPMPPRLGDQVRTCADINKARHILGYEPKVSLEEGLQAEVRWYMQDILPHLKEGSGLL